MAESSELKSTDSFEDRLTGLLVAWVDGVRVRARAVLVATTLVTLASAVFTASLVGFNTSHTALLSDDLPFWKEYMAFAEVFPILDEALLVVVDAESTLAARDAAELLAGRPGRAAKLITATRLPRGGVKVANAFHNMRSSSALTSPALRNAA